MRRIAAAAGGSTAGKAGGDKAGTEECRRGSQCGVGRDGWFEGRADEPGPERVALPVGSRAGMDVSVGGVK